MIRYSRACVSYEDFLYRGLLLTRKLLNQWFLLANLKSSLRKCYDRHDDLVGHQNICVINDIICSTCRKHFPVFSSFMTYHRVYNQINTTGVTSGAGTAYPSGAPEFIPGFQWGSCCSIFSSMCMFCRSLFVLWYFFFWPLCCLSFDIRILITHLVSSNSSCLVAIILYVLLQFTVSDCLFSNFKLFLQYYR